MDGRHDSLDVIPAVEYLSCEFPRDSVPIL
jgi:hypothetical protein